MRGSDIVSRVRLILNDADAVRWTDGEFVNWINDGCSFIALLRPDSCVVNGSLTCVAGTKQSIAALSPAGLRVLDVVRNLTTNRAMRLVDRETLDTQIPTWHSATQGSPTNYVFDNRDPKTLYVYPPAAACQLIEVIYSRVPVAITLGTLSSTDLSLDDVFLDPLLNYVLFRAKSKDASFAKDVNLAAAYRQLAEQLLTGKASADRAYSPDMNSPGGMPSPGASMGGV